MSRNPLIPREVLFGNPDRLSPQLSPDGRRTAFLAPFDGHLNVWSATVGTPGQIPLTRDGNRGIRAFWWAHDRTHLLYLQDRDGDENTHLYAVHLPTGRVRDMTPFDGVQARLIARHASRPGSVLVGLNRRTSALHDVYELDLASGELALREHNPGFTAWTADAALRVRAALGPVDNAGLAVRVRDGDGWRVLHQVDHEDTTLLKVVGLAEEGTRLLLLSSRDAETVRLLDIDIATGAQRVACADPEHDVVGAGVHPVTGAAQYALVQRERGDLEVLDDTIAADVAALRGRRAGDLTIASRDATDRTWLVQYNVDDGPSEYHWYDRAGGAARTLFRHTDRLAGYALAKVEPFAFNARDGLLVRGYLTFPPGARRTGLPAVVAVHGGPWTRDVWGYRGETQWLANRGYLAVQVNFRGSTGYGKAFVNAGDREWGAAMHDDLVDAVELLVRRGVVDPDRVAVYGGSYGGYAALVGVTFTPTLFRCAVAVAAPADLRTFLRSIPPQWRAIADRLDRRIGDPDTDAEFLWSRSPLSRVDRVRVPVLIAQGANDPRVPASESEQLVAALRERGVAHEYLLFPDEGHGFLKPANRMRFYAAAERFLAEHLGGRREA